MANELLISPEFREIPRNFFGLIADDEEQAAKHTGQSLISALASTDFSTPQIAIATSFTDMITQAFTGNNGNPVDVVMLDHDYSKNRKLWQPNSAQVEQFALQAGIDFTPYRNSPLYLYQDSITFSLFLRQLGFNKNIFIVSGGVPIADEIIRFMEDLEEAVPGYMPLFPIDGYADKEAIKHPKGYLTFARGINIFNQSGRTDVYWDDKMVKGATGPDILRSLFTAKNIQRQ